MQRNLDKGEQGGKNKMAKAGVHSEEKKQRKRRNSDISDIYEGRKLGLDTKNKRKNWKEELVIGGDFNARTSAAGGKITGSNSRTSKDKTANEEERIMLKNLEEMELMIMNRNYEGDWEGEYTYTSQRGNSVIDYIACDNAAWGRAEKMRIEERADSDHCALTLVTESEPVSTINHKGEKMIRKDWSKRGLAFYKGELEDVDISEWDKLKDKIRNAVKTKEVKTRNWIEEDWSHDEIARMKEELKYFKRKLKRGEATWEDYTRNRKEYIFQLNN